VSCDQNCARCPTPCDKVLGQRSGTGIAGAADHQQIRRGICPQCGKRFTSPKAAKGVYGVGCVTFCSMECCEAYPHGWPREKKRKS
jgi:hypothetical protein